MGVFYHKNLFFTPFGKVFQVLEITVFFRQTSSVNLLAIWIIALFSLSACSGIRHVAIKTVAPAFWQASNAFEREGDWHAFREGVPGSLKFLDGLLEVRPDDESLLVAATKGYAGYAFAVHETLYLADKLAQKESSLHHRRAVLAYSKALDYGLHWLSEEGIARSEFSRALREPGGVLRLLDGHLGSGEQDLEGVLYTASALASLINLKKDDIALVGELPLAKALFDWVCDKRPDIAHGACALFQASYLVSRPKMLGGDPDAGKKLFERFIGGHPHHPLARVVYLEHYVLPTGNSALYRRQKKALLDFEKLYSKHQSWSPNQKNHPAFGDTSLRIYQAMAMERFKIIRRFEREIF